jgi:hypothetical protein
MKSFQILSRIFTTSLFLWLSNLDAAARTNSIQPGEIKAGSITNAGQSDFYSFTVASNDYLYVTLLLTNGPGTPWFYVSVDGDYLHAPTRDGSFVIWNWRPPHSGTCTIEVVDDSHTLSFDYLVAVTSICGTNIREAGDGAEALIAGQITGGHISITDFDTFTFHGNSNDSVYLTLLLTNGPGSGPYFYLFGPDCETLPGIGRTPYLANWSGRLPMTGTYTVGVIDDNNREEFDYLLRLTIIGGENAREPEDGPEPVRPGQSTGGHISLGDLDTYTFTANSNDLTYIRLLLTNGPASNPYFYLYGPDGNPVASSSYVSFKAEWSGVLPQTGKYTVAVIHSVLNGEFDYNLCLARFPGTNYPDAGEGPEFVGSGQMRTGALPPGDLDVYAIEAIAGDSLQVNLAQTEGPGQLYVLLYGPDGTLLDTRLTSTPGVMRIHCLTATGTYQILCMDNAGDSEVGYELKVALSPGPSPSSDSDHPYLTIFRCMADTVLRWPTNAEGFQLEYSTDALSAAWSNLPPPYSVIANHYYVTNRSDDRMRIYRLKK